MNASVHTSDAMARRVAKRRTAERRFRVYGMIAIALAIAALAALFISIIGNGYTAFQQTFIELEVTYDPEVLGIGEDRDSKALSAANYQGLVKKTMRGMFPDVKGRKAKRTLYGIVSTGASYMLRERVLADPGLIGRTERVRVPADDDIDMLVKGHIDRSAPTSERRVKDNQLGWVAALEEAGRIEKRFNTTFFTAGDSREPELAGIRGAAAGSFYTLLVTLVLSFPIGVAAAVYLEEFAPTNRLTDLIEVNINNLAAVPSIIFGLLGLAVFINFFGLPRSAPLVGGLVLSLMTLPTIIIASRAALKSVPPSIREAALGMGASKMQTITHHVLPLAMPGMLTIYSSDNPPPDPRLLSDAFRMATLATRMLHDVLDALARLDVDKAIQVARGDVELDSEFQAALRRLSTYIMEDARNVGHTINVTFIVKSLERIGDHAKNIAEYVVFLVKGKDVRHVSPDSIDTEELDR